MVHNGPLSNGSSIHRWGPQDLAELRVSQAQPRTLPRVSADPGLVVEEIMTGWSGAVLGTERSGGMQIVALEDRHGKVRSFPLGFGFLIDGAAVELIAPAPRSAVTPGPQRTASGSIKVAGHRARVARANRIWVEGKHDAELIEKVWGDDLRVEGIVVEPLGGIDDLRQAIIGFGPSKDRRLGILVDHLIPGSKESRIAEDAMTLPGAAGNVLIVGHPYVDVWQAIRPRVLGIEAWPQIPRSVEWKTGVMRAFGWPGDTAQAWQRLLSAVHSYSDLEPSLLGRVEEVIDFLTAGVS